jgi:hypothetical protein
MTVALYVLSGDHTPRRPSVWYDGNVSSGGHCAFVTGLVLGGKGAESLSPGLLL